MLHPFLIVITLIALWLVLSEGSLSSWAIGIPALLLVYAVCDQCFGVSKSKRSSAISLRGLLRFALFFMCESIRGGIDVGRIVLSLKPRLNPQFFDYPLALQNTAAQQLFINSISLLPGTLSADWQGKVARIHALDHNADTIKGIRRLESRVAEMFGEKTCP